MKRVLISGGGVAGPVLAFWLHNYDFKVTVVERARNSRYGGQAIDLRGPAVEVARRMGVLEQIEKQRTSLKGASKLDEHGNEVWRSDEMTLSAGRFDSGDIEIFRSDLTKILYEATAERAEYVFGDSIASLHERDGDVEVEFESGSKSSFDAIIGADGLYSKVRTLWWGPTSNHLHFLGSYIAVFSTKNFVGIKDRQVAILGKTGRLLLFPIHDNSELRVFVGFDSKQLSDDLTDEQRKAIIVDHCGNIGWKVPEVLEAMKHAPDFYFTPMAQIRMDRWHKGKVALLGDAAWCAAPASGQGTSLALVGAYILAQEMHRHFASAFANYDRRMRPFVVINQALALQDSSEEELDRAKNAVSLDDA